MSLRAKRPHLTLWLVRHGESEQNARMLGQDYPDYPDHAAPLTNAGLTQADAAGEFLAEKLKSDDCPPEDAVLFHSPYVRARQAHPEKAARRAGHRQRHAGRAGLRPVRRGVP